MKQGDDLGQEMRGWIYLGSNRVAVHGDVQVEKPTRQ